MQISIRISIFDHCGHRPLQSAWELLQPKAIKTEVNSMSDILFRTYCVRIGPFTAIQAHSYQWTWSLGTMWFSVNLIWSFCLLLRFRFQASDRQACQTDNRFVCAASRWIDRNVPYRTMATSVSQWINKIQIKMCYRLLRIALSGYWLRLNFNAFFYSIQYHSLDNVQWRSTFDTLIFVYPSPTVHKEHVSIRNFLMSQSSENRIDRFALIAISYMIYIW